MLELHTQKGAHVKNLIFESLLGPHKGGITTNGNIYSVGWDDFK